MVIKLDDGEGNDDEHAHVVEGRLDLLLGMEPGVLADVIERVLTRELAGALVHRYEPATTVGAFDAVLVETAVPPLVDAGLVIMLPGRDDPTGTVEIRRGDEVFTLPPDDEIVASLLSLLRQELGRS